MVYNTLTEKFWKLFQNLTENILNYLNLNSLQLKLFRTVNVKRKLTL